jgi:hypothetical protein
MDALSVFCEKLLALLIISIIFAAEIASRVAHVPTNRPTSRIVGSGGKAMRVNV